MNANLKKASLPYNKIYICDKTTTTASSVTVLISNIDLHKT